MKVSTSSVHLRFECSSISFLIMFIILSFFWQFLNPVSPLHFQLVTVCHRFISFIPQHSFQAFPLPYR